MRLQRLLAALDKKISKLFSLQSFGHGNEKGIHQWIYFMNVGPTIGVVGVDGKLHTVMSYYSVRHYVNGKKLQKRIPVRKDLKEGERLATREEIEQYLIARGKWADEAGPGYISYS